jgi:hypothetical protein
VKNKDDILGKLISEAKDRMLTLVADRQTDWDRYIAKRRAAHYDDLYRQYSGYQALVVRSGASQSTACTLPSGASCPPEARFVVFGAGEPHRVVRKNGTVMYEPDPDMPFPTKMSGITALECDATNAVCGPASVTVYNSELGLCFGDSGGGLFKYLAPSGRKAGYGHFALVGIVSGAGQAGDCKPVAQVEEIPVRRVVRLDQKAVHDWLSVMTEETVAFTNELTDDYPSNDGGGNPSEVELK